MKQFEETLEEREHYLKKIIKSLSKVSDVSTREVRMDANRSLNTKKTQRIKYHVEQDRLLKSQDRRNLPNLLKADRIYVKKSNHIESLKEKKIESDASLKRVNFQYRKLKMQKQKLARKLHQSQERYKSSPTFQYLIFDAKEIKQNRISQIFQKGTLRSPTAKEKAEQEIVNRLKTTVNSSRKHIRNIYRDEEYMKSIVNSSRRVLSEFKSEVQREKVNQFIFLTEEEENTNKHSQDPLMKTQSIKAQTNVKKIKRKSLIDLIRLSTSREENKAERLDQKLTFKEATEYRGVDATIQTLRKHIDRDNKLKESIVFSGLKKLLYGDRKGRFIQDNAFKTRLKGECSEHYLNILKAQEGMLQNFQGSEFNKKNLVQKFSDILGKIHKNEGRNEALFDQLR